MIQSLYTFISINFTFSQQKISSLSLLRSLSFIQRSQLKKQRNLDDISLSPQEICGRPTDIRSLQKFSLLHSQDQYACPYSSPTMSTGTSPLDVSPTINVVTNTNINNTDSSSQYNPQKPSLLLLSGRKTFGRTGNNLIEFLHALQVARDKELILGIEEGSWAMIVLTGMFMKGEDEERWEEMFCGELFIDKLKYVLLFDLLMDGLMD